MFKDGVLNFVDKIKLEVPRGMRPKLSLNDGFDEIIKVNEIQNNPKQNKTKKIFTLFEL